MKWSGEKIAKLREMCFAEISNAEIANQLGTPINEIHAKRSQLGITIPKIKAAKGQPAITVKPEFERSVTDMEKSLPKNLPVGVREAFKRLQNELLLSMAKNQTSIEDAKRYAATSDIVSLAQSTLERWITEG